MTSDPSTDQTPAIIARAGSYYRNTRYLMATLTVVMGFWFGYDGFVGWPAENAKIADITQQLNAAKDRSDQAEIARLGTDLKSHSHHSDTDLRFQRLLAVTLPPLGIALLIWALYNSRGEYRLANDTIYVPSHPPVPMASVRELDEEQWDRKGIALVSYELSNGKVGTIKLDDFVYDRTGTDAIYDKIRAALQMPEETPQQAAPTTPESEVPPTEQNS